MTEKTSLVPLDTPVPSPGSMPLRNDRYEKFAFKRALLMPKAEAYRSAGWSARDDHAAAGNASRLERRADIAERIAYLQRTGREANFRAKRQRLEEFLWNVHESRISDLWETVEVEKRDKKGNAVLDAEGKPIMVKRQVPRLLSELSEDAQRVIETCSVDGNGRVVPKLYSKMQANQELRKLLGIGILTADDDADDPSRLSDEALIARLAELSRMLGIEIDLSCNFGGGKQL